MPSSAGRGRRAANAACQRGKWSSWTGLTLRASWWPLLPRCELRRPRRPCPRRALSTAVWKFVRGVMRRRSAGRGRRVGGEAGRVSVGVAPVERGGGLLIAVLEGQQLVLDIDEVGEVVG